MHQNPTEITCCPLVCDKPAKTHQNNSRQLPPLSGSCTISNKISCTHTVAKQMWVPHPSVHHTLVLYIAQAALSDQFGAQCRIVGWWWSLHGTETFWFYHIGRVWVKLHFNDTNFLANLFSTLCMRTKLAQFGDLEYGEKKKTEQHILFMQIEK